MTKMQTYRAQKVRRRNRRRWLARVKRAVGRLAPVWPKPQGSRRPAFCCLCGPGQTCEAHAYFEGMHRAA